MYQMETKGAYSFVVAYLPYTFPSACVGPSIATLLVRNVYLACFFSPLIIIIIIFLPLFECRTHEIANDWASVTANEERKVDI